LFVLVLGTAASLRAGATTRRLAVLPLESSHAEGHLNPNAEVSLEEMLRDTAVNALSSNGWTIVTSDATAQAIRKSGSEGGRCTDDRCRASVAKVLDAGYFLTGTVQFADGELVCSIRLHESASNRILTSERVTGATGKAIREALEAKAADFFRHVRLSSSGEVSGVVANPPSAGETLTAAAAPAGTVPTAGTLAVWGTPEGAAVSVTADDGLVRKGALPWEGHGLPVQRYRVRVTHKGYAEADATVDLVGGKKTSINVNLRAEHSPSGTGAPCVNDIDCAGADVCDSYRCTPPAHTGRH
jgi:hypothetical protein